MADGIYIGMAGAAARLSQLDSIADNLANVRTPGFKSARPAFETFLAPSASPDQAFPVGVATGFDLRPGSVQHTGAPLDILPDGEAFLPVSTPSGMAYTRDGRLTTDSEGHLRAASHPLVDANNQPITVPPGSTATVTSDGIVKANGQEVGRLALYTLSGPLNRVGPSLLAPGQGGVATPAETTVRVGEVEAGNSTALEATVQMVAAQRHYETSMQAIQTYRKLDERVSELGRVR